MTSLYVIWSVYVLVNILLQIFMTYIFKRGFIDDLKHNSNKLYKYTVEDAVNRSISLESAYRRFATLGLNAWALPVAFTLSVFVVIISYI